MSGVGHSNFFPSERMEEKTTLLRANPDMASNITKLLYLAGSRYVSTRACTGLLIFPIPPIMV